MPTREDISALKVKIHEMENEKRLLKAKILRNKQTIANRNRSIKATFSTGHDNKPLVTASSTTIQSLRKTVEQLRNTLKVKQDELEKLKRSDNAAIYEEMQIELELLKEECERRKNAATERKSRDNELTSHLERVKQQAKSAPGHEAAVKDIQKEMDELTERLFAFRKTELRMEAGDLVMELQKDPSKIPEARQKIEEEIENLKKAIEQKRAEIEQTQQDEAKDTEALRERIRAQSERLLKAVHQEEQ